MPRLALLIRLLFETAVAAVIIVIFGRVLIAYFTYYVWGKHHLWFAALCFFSLLALLGWLIACVIIVHKKRSIRQFRKILAFLTLGWMSAASLVSAAVFAESYDPRVFTFLHRLAQAKASRQKISVDGLTNFEWEKLCFLGPYGSAKDLQDLTGNQYIIGYVDTTHTGLSYLVFLLPDKHSLAIGIPQGLFDSMSCLDRQEARSLTFGLAGNKVCAQVISMTMKKKCISIKSC